MKKVLSLILSLCMIVGVTATSFSAYAAAPATVDTIKIKSATLDLKPGSKPKFTGVSAEPNSYFIEYEEWDEVGTNRFITSSEWYNGFSSSECPLIDNFVAGKQYRYRICLQAIDPDCNNKFACQFSKNTKISVNGTTYSVKSSNVYLDDFDGVNYRITISDVLTVTASSKINASKFSASLSKSSYTYDGKAKKPTVTIKDGKGKKLVSGTDYSVKYSNNTKVGKATAKITYKGKYTGSKTLTFKINPKSTTLKSLTAASKGFTAKWNKQATQTTGYQIQYSTSSKFSSAKTATVSKNSTTSKKITGLKAKKKYYVRIRTYTTVSGTKYYSSWSKAKTVTTKK